MVKSIGSSVGSKSSKNSRASTAYPERFYKKLYVYTRGQGPIKKKYAIYQDVESVRILK